MFHCFVLVLRYGQFVCVCVSRCVCVVVVVVVVVFLIRDQWPGEPGRAVSVHKLPNDYFSESASACFYSYCNTMTGVMMMIMWSFVSSDVG